MEGVSVGDHDLPCYLSGNGWIERTIRLQLQAEPCSAHRVGSPGLSRRHAVAAGRVEFVLTERLN